MKKSLLLVLAAALTATINAQDLQLDPNYQQLDYAAKMTDVSLDSSSLPLIYINTGGEAIADEPRIVVDMGIIYNGAGMYNHADDAFNNYNGKVSIEIRGSSSQSFPKKSYSLELQDDAGNSINNPLMGMASDDDWILYGPYSDKSLLRNALTYHLGSKQGAYAPDFRYCEVIINDEYQGLYLLLEKIKVQKDRVNVDAMSPDDNAGINVSGGYLIKVDRNDYASPVSDFFYSEYPGNGWPYDVMYVYVDPKPELITDEQKDYIHNYINDFETVMNSDEKYDLENGYHKYIDLNSFVDLFIINEMSKNVDAYRLSTYFYKNNDALGGKLCAGPLWDFNLAWGNVDYCDAFKTTNFFTDCGTGPAWWIDLYEDPNFQNRLNCRWNELREGAFSTDSIFDWIDQQVNLMGDAVDRNFDTWNVLNDYVWPNHYVGGNYENEISYLKLWISARLSWMDSHMPGDDAVCDIAGSYTVAITEFNYNSDNYNDSKSWVELHNFGGTSVDISNWKLKDETPFNSYTIPSGTILSPDEYLILCGSIDTFLMIHSDVTNYIGSFGFGFDNTSGSVKLEDNLGATVRLINYVDSLPWPKGADGLGPGLQILNETGNENDPTNWIASCVLGTPGYEYTPCNYDLIVSEINYNSLPGYNVGDWIEILNRSASAINIGGWIVRDANIGNIFVIPNGNILDPGERLVIADSLAGFTSKFPSVSNVIGEPAFHFSNKGDGVRIYTPTGLIKYSVRYNDKVPWPADADGLGFTLESIDEPGNPNIPTSWVAGCLFGSPGNPFVVPCGNAVEDLNAASFTLAPNPFSNQIVITLDAQIKAEQIFITDVLGQKIMDLHATSNTIIWNGNNNSGAPVPDGVYLISVVDSNGNISSSRVIKNN